MVMFGHHKLDYRRIWKAFIMYFMILCIIMVNELILIRIGWVDTKTLFTEVIDGVEYNGYFDASSRDMGYAVGLPAGGAIELIGKYVLWMTPKAWKDPYVPILWELFPVIIYGGLACLAMCSYWEHKHIKEDVLFVVGKVNGFIENFKAKRAGKKSDETNQSPAESTEDVVQEKDSENGDKDTPSNA